MTFRAALIVLSLTLVFACDLAALETIRGVVRDGSDFQCSAGCGTYYIEPDPPYAATMLGGNFRAYLDLHVQITGFRDVCSGCSVLFPSDPVLVLPPLTAVDEEPDAIPREAGLKQNFPNPFNPATTIEYALAHPSIVRLAVFDILGREVALLVSAEMTPGVHRETWSPGDLPGGIYFCRLRVAYSGKNSLITTKMLYVR
jgi:hypothetical protein